MRFSTLKKIIIEWKHNVKFLLYIANKKQIVI